MVIGKGLVAGSFRSYENQQRFLVFASGVSNSKSSTNEDFSREELLLREHLRANPEKVLVYFSTTSVNDPDLQQTLYVQHKLHIEEFIRANARKYTIFRLSNLAGRSDNPNTILNYFYQHIAKGIPFQLWKNSERNIIDTDDVFRIADHMLQHGMNVNHVLNIANPESYPVTQIVEAIETYCGRKGDYTTVNKGGGPVVIDTTAMLTVSEKLDIRFGAGYLEKMLHKYYSR